LHAASESSLEGLVGRTGTQHLIDVVGGSTLDLASNERRVILKAASHLTGSYNKEDKIEWGFEPAMREALAAYRREFPMNASEDRDPTARTIEFLQPATYEAFLAVNSADLKVVHQHVQKFREYGRSVFFYSDCMPLGSRWRAVLEVLMGQRQSTGTFSSKASCGVILYGPSGVGRVQDEEIDLMWEAERSGTFPIIPVILPEVDRNWTPSGWMKIRTYCDLRGDHDHSQWLRLMETIKAFDTGLGRGEPYAP
jgi:hypothetical protein